MTTAENVRGGHGGRRAGAGRPQQRIHIDREAALQLHALVRKWRTEATPEEPHLTASSVVSELITDAWWREIGQHEPGKR